MTIATDLLEHLTKQEVLATFDAVATALPPGSATAGENAVVR